MQTKSRIFILSGPSGSGKTTLYKKLLLSKKLKRSLKRPVSLTTRPRRANEMDTRDYKFISEKEFLLRKKRSEFLEFQNIFGYYYATDKKAIKSLLKKNKDILLCVDVKGKEFLKRIFPQAVTIFIVPPSEATLRHRLNGRSTEGKREIYKRLSLAKKEIAQADKYDYVVVNDNLNNALKKLESIIIAQSCKTIC